MISSAATAPANPLPPEALFTTASATAAHAAISREATSPPLSCGAIAKNLFPFTAPVRLRPQQHLAPPSVCRYSLILPLRNRAQLRPPQPFAVIVTPSSSPHGLVWRDNPRQSARARPRRRRAVCGEGPHSSTTPNSFVRNDMLQYIVPLMQRSPSSTSPKVSCEEYLVKFPTLSPPPEDILNGNHKQLHSGKGNAAHQQTTNFIYMITRPKVLSPKDRPRNIPNFENTILPTMKILYFGLCIALFVSNIREQTKVSNQTTTISFRSIVMSD